MFGDRIKEEVEPKETSGQIPFYSDSILPIDSEEDTEDNSMLAYSLLTKIQDSYYSKNEGCNIENYKGENGKGDCNYCRDEFEYL